MLLWNGFPYVTTAAELCTLLASLTVLLVEAPYNCACVPLCRTLADGAAPIESSPCALGTLYASLAAWGLWIPLLNGSEWMGNDGKWSITISFLLLMVAGLLLVLAHVFGEGKREPEGAADALWFALACVVPMLNVGLYADLPIDSNAWGNGHWHWVWGAVLVLGNVGLLYMAANAGAPRDEEPGPEVRGTKAAPQLAIAAP